MSWSQFLIPLSGVVVGGGLSVTAQWYVLRQQHLNWISEKWWERKVDNYVLITESLLSLLNIVRRMAKAAENEEYQRGLDVEELMRNLEQQMTTLQKTMDAGAFIVSAEANYALIRFRYDVMNIGAGKDFDPLDTELEVKTIQEIEKRIYACIEDVRVAAVSDLRVNKP